MSEARKRAERERDVERHVRVTVEAELKGERKAHEETKKANREAERIFLDELLARRAAESALAAEREAHEETRAKLATAQGINDCREREVKEIMESDLPYAQKTREASENFRLYQQQREMALAASSRLAAAEECLRAHQWCVTTAFATISGDLFVATCPECEQTEEHGHAPDCRIGAFLAGGKT